VKESYANGIVIESEESPWRKYWGENTSGTINLCNRVAIAGGKIELRPLEIRSFRIHMKSKIEVKHMKEETQSYNPYL
jgi:hypothetical protein